MIDNNSSDRNRFINGILIVVAIAMLAASIYSVYLAWRTGLAQSRAETASRLMAIRTSPRSTETPGINAWVSWSLLNSGEYGKGNDRLRQLVAPRTGGQIPVEFQGLLDALRLPVPEPRPVVIRSDNAFDQTAANEQSTGSLEFRNVNFVENADQLFVLTARQNETVQAQIKEFSSAATTHLMAINNAWLSEPSLEPLRNLSRVRSARVARFYVLNEDESLISLPLGESGRSGEPLYLSERDEFRKNPLSPSFVSNNFFFNFQFEKPLTDQAAFSGMYLDLGGLGLVASVTKPVVYNGKRSVLGADIAFDIDWEEFARNLSPNLVSHVAHTRNDAENWNPWNEFLSGLPSDEPELRNELTELAERESLDSEPSPRKSVYLATTRAGSDVMAIQVNRSTWLLLLVAANEIKLPWTTILLTSLVFLSLLVRIEQSRRTAVAAQRSARGEMQEKQNLLETMQVPLMVVDPNTDEVVFCNRAANTIGMSQGNFFGKDIVAQDHDSQSHYRQTQTLGEEHRRAYGVPICTDAAASNYAIVRSVAVTAPIESLHADERHRLGILFLVNEERDLELLLKQRMEKVRIDEKRQLSGLMNHGIDSLARILRNQMESKTALESDERQRFVRWLSNYLSERIQLVAWTLENWGRTPSATEQRIITRSTVETTVANYNDLFETVANDRHLREQLHWNNGTVSASKESVERPANTAGGLIQTQFDWSEDSCFAVPRDGVFGFFLSEALINAVRHGQPGTQVDFNIAENRVRNELTFTITNRTNNGSVVDGKPFGGTDIMQELARLAGWSTPEFNLDVGVHKLTWSIPAIRRKAERLGD